jgi:uncharacterized protein
MVCVRKLVWESWNVAHIARHEVVPDEVEEVCHGPYITRQTYDDRHLLIGPTRSGRMLVIILGPTDQAEVYYPVTARSASMKERRIYKNEQRGES